MTATIAAIYRHPVKGLSPESLSEAQLEANLGLANDRRYALARASTRFDPQNPKWMPKGKFWMLRRDEKLATLETEFDDRSSILTVLRDGKQVARGDLSSPVGRAIIEDFFAAYLKAEARNKPKLVEMPVGRMFSDHKTPVLSIINKASLVDLERIAKSAIDPRRFRGNLLIEGLNPWQEFTWVGRTVTVGGAELEVTETIDRCAAINVNPDSGVRDMNLVKSLQAGFGHVNMGVYARVASAATIRVGDEVKPAN